MARTPRFNLEDGDLSTSFLPSEISNPEPPNPPVIDDPNSAEPPVSNPTNPNTPVIEDEDPSNPMPPPQQPLPPPPSPSEDDFLPPPPAEPPSVPEIAEPVPPPAPFASAAPPSSASVLGTFTLPGQSGSQAAFGGFRGPSVPPPLRSGPGAPLVGGTNGGDGLLAMAQALGISEEELIDQILSRVQGRG